MSLFSSSASLSRFTFIARLEGLSFLLLVFIAMPLKYWAGLPLAVKYTGWAHGVLFMAYMAQLAITAYQLKWDVVKVLLALSASLLPFGPFLFERFYQKK